MAGPNDGMTDKQAAEFIRDHAKGLMKQAKDAKLDMLAYLLEMAVVEADETANRIEDRKQGP